jgi:hypothetical protein
MLQNLKSGHGIILYKIAISINQLTNCVKWYYKIKKSIHQNLFRHDGWN